MAKKDVNRFGIKDVSEVDFSASGKLSESEKKENDELIAKLDESLGL